VNDPFDVLRLDSDRIEPDAAFAADLRERISTALAAAGLPVVDLPTRRSTTMTDLDSATTATTSSPGTGVTDAGNAPAAPAIVPYICVHDAAAALHWYADVFGAVETVRYTGDDGRIGHAEMRLNGALLMLSEPYPEYGVVAPEPGASSFSLHIEVSEVDAVHARAVDSGASSISDPADQAYGSRSCTIIDPFGHRWMVQTPIATPTLDEINAAMDDFTATAPPVDEQ
jgi:uncharacterized glyoxalase superfamily protein PhnB